MKLRWFYKMNQVSAAGVSTERAKTGEGLIECANRLKATTKPVLQYRENFGAWTNVPVFCELTNPHTGTSVVVEQGLLDD